MHPLVEGLESTMEEIRFFCRKEPDILRLVNEAATPIAKHGEIGKGRPDRDGIANSKTANDATYALRRLKRDNPVLAQEVIEGRLSAHAAAVKAGFRRKTWTAPAEFDALAEAIARRFPGARLVRP